MIRPLILILLSTMLFLAMVVNLSLKPRYYAKLAGFLTVFSVAGGLILYGYGFSYVLGDQILAVFRTAFAVGNMFLGKNEISTVAEAPWLGHTWVMTVFWLCHLAAFYTTASTAFVTIGAETMKKLRLFLVRRGRLVVVYGSGETAYKTAKAYENEPGVSLVYVTDKPQQASKLSALVRSDRDALESTVKFWKGIGAGHKRKIEVYSLENDMQLSVCFADRCRDSLKALGVPPENISLTMIGFEENGEIFRSSGEKFGFGHVNIFDIPEIAARTAVINCPPWNQIEFDENGRAKNGINAMVIGFGSMGQALLRQILINSQFYGADFKASVFSKDIGSEIGFTVAEMPEMFRQYDITMNEGDGRSARVYGFLKENIENINYIAVCTGSDDMTGEVSLAMMRFLKDMGKNIPIVTCSRTDVHVMDGTSEKRYPLFTRENLSGEVLDRLPMLLNQAYCGENGKSTGENWACCDAFSRKSCRSAADFYPGLCRASGISETEVSEKWNLSDEMKDNLGHHEHMRWCAFHFCSGFRAMTEEEWNIRAEAYLKEKSENGKSTMRIGKDIKSKTHACLVPWEKLDELSILESEVTGCRVNYKEADMANVMMIPKILEEKYK